MDDITNCKFGKLMQILVGDNFLDIFK